MDSRVTLEKTKEEEEQLTRAKALAKEVLKRISETDMSKASFDQRYTFSIHEILEASFLCLHHNEDLVVWFANGLEGTPFKTVKSRDEFNAELNRQLLYVNNVRTLPNMLERLKYKVVVLKADINKLPEHCCREEYIAIFNDIDAQLAAADNMLSAMGTVNLIDTMNEQAARNDEMLLHMGTIDNANQRFNTLRDHIDAEKAIVLANEAASKNGLYDRLSSVASSVYCFFANSPIQNDGSGNTDVYGYSPHQ